MTRGGAKGFLVASAAALALAMVWTPAASADGTTVIADCEWTDEPPVAECSEEELPVGVDMFKVSYALCPGLLLGEFGGLPSLELGPVTVCRWGDSARGYEAQIVRLDTDSGPVALIGRGGGWEPRPGELMLLVGRRSLTITSRCPPGEPVCLADPED